jgi:glycosyltransferase involved in cell wall biosynthesis
MTTGCNALYCEGPGDIVGAFRAWQKGADFAKETAVTHSGQFFEFCRRESASFYAVSYCDRAETVSDGRNTVANLPRPGIRIPKIGYELTVLLYVVRLLLLALRIRPRVIYVTSGVTDWAYLPILRLSGAKLVPILHNTLWPEGFAPRMGLRQRVYGWVWRHCVWRTLAASPACIRQLSRVAATPVAATLFMPTFPAASFPEVRSAPVAEEPFRVLFVGRIDETKGVFDLLEMASQLPHVLFSVCGEGSQLPEVRRQIAARGLGNVTVHGRLERPALIQQYLAAHVVVVPTTSRFCEGFAMVVAEAILLLRPVITNPVVPAAEVLPGAVISVPTDDTAAYVRAIERLRCEKDEYARLVQGARELRALILDDSTSFLQELSRINAFSGGATHPGR